MRTDTTELIHDLHAVGMGIEAGERVPKERFIEAANRLEELSHKVDDAHTMLLAEMSATQDMEARAVKAERERDELAATVAKLPKYHDGRAFVPGADLAYFWVSGGVVQTTERQPPHRRLYPTAAECERGEGGGDAN